MTYRIIEGELYHAVKSDWRSIEDLPCVFHLPNGKGCSMNLAGDSLRRPCTERHESVVFFDDAKYIEYLSKKLKS